MRIAALTLPGLISALVMLSVPVPLLAQETPCCRCYNNAEQTQHQFETFTYTGGGSSLLETICDTNPHQCTKCNEIPEEGGSSGCHATWSPEELELTCTDHDSCQPDFLFSMLAKRNGPMGVLATLSPEGLLAVMRDADIGDEVVLNMDRMAVQIRGGCDAEGQAIVAHYPVSSEQMKALLSVGEFVRAEKPVSVSGS